MTIGYERVQEPPPTAEASADPRSAQVAVVLIAVVLMVGVVTYLGPILKPFLVAVFLYFSTKAAAGVLIRRRFPPLLAYLTLFVIGSVAATAVALLAYDEAQGFLAVWPSYQERILGAIQQAPEEARQPLTDLFTTWLPEVFKYLFERGVGMFELLIMTVFYLLFIILGASRLPQRVRRAFPGPRGESILVIAGKIDAGMGRFMQVKTLVSLGMAASAAALLYLFHLRAWLLWAILFFGFNYITYIGSFVACLPPVVAAYLDLPSPVVATVLAVLVVVNRFIWIDYVEIKMAGRNLNIDSVLLFLWLAYWGWMWGVVGLILAFPMVMSLKIVLENLQTTRGWAMLMSEE